MKTDKIILTDCDGVIFDYDGGFIRYMAGLGYQPNGELRFDDMFGLDYEAMDGHFDDFNSSVHFGKLDALPFAREAMTELYLEGYRFIAITAIQPERKLRDARMENLHRALGFEFSDIHCTGYDTKETALRLYQPTVWVDDHPGHVESGMRAFHYSFLMDSPFNRDHHIGHRAMDWRDITEHLGLIILDDDAITNNA